MSGLPLAPTVRALGAVGAVGALALTLHTAANLRRLRRLPLDPPLVAERVSLLVPARNEAHRIVPTVTSLLSQVQLLDVEIIVLDDGSEDGTAQVVQAAADGDPHLRVVAGNGLPTGWLGKPYACHQLARAATGSALCFIDADVTLAPESVASAVTLLRESGLDAISPYPRQVARGLGPRLVQPLIEWSWLTMLPLGAAERSPRPTLAAATGQFFVVDHDAYRRAGGHAAVADEVLDDVGLMRAVKRTGGRAVAVDGSDLATCQMYNSWEEMVEGYTKSLWSAFGSRSGAAAVVTALCLAYCAPAAAVLVGSRVGLVGYAAGVLGRTLVARTTHQPVLPDVLAHPASIATFGYLVGRSWRAHRRGTLSWKGRPVGNAPTPRT